MTDAGKSDQWSTLSPAEKKLELFRRQKDLLDTFLATGAISQAQYDKSLSCLIEKMNIDSLYSSDSIHGNSTNKCSE